MSWRCKHGFHKWTKWDLPHNAFDPRVVPKISRFCLRTGCDAYEEKRMYDL